MRASKKQELIKKTQTDINQLLEVTPKKAHKLVSTGEWDLKTFLAWCRAIDADRVQKIYEERTSSW
jgi:hypothetical protein